MITAATRWSHYLQMLSEIAYCLSTTRQVEESTRHLSEGDLEEKQALILEDKAPGLINQDSKVHMTS
jgi:hypothetical protein